MEPAMYQTPNVTDYHSINYSLANSAAIPDGTAYATAGDSASSIEPLSTDVALPDSSSLHDANVHNMDHNLATNEAPSGSTVVDVNQADGVSVADKNGNSVGDASQESAMKDSTQGTGFDSINGNGTAEGKNFPSAAMSTEEDRLWSIVRVNSLDFNAWTALIQETEKVAELARERGFGCLKQKLFWLLLERLLWLLLVLALSFLFSTCVHMKYCFFCFFFSMRFLLEICCY